MIENILTPDIPLSKPFIQVIPTKKSDIIYSTLCSLVQVWAPVTETDSDMTIQNMTIYTQYISQSLIILPCNYILSLSVTHIPSNKPKCTHVHVQRHSLYVPQKA